MKHAWWIPVEVARHERRRLWLLKRLGEVDDSTAIDDLRVFQDQRMGPQAKPMPTIATLAARWGWGTTSAWRLYRDWQTWSDPKYLKVWEEVWNESGMRQRLGGRKCGTKSSAQTPVVGLARNDAAIGGEEKWNESGHTRGEGPPSSQNALHSVPSHEPAGLVELQARLSAAVVDDDMTLIETLLEELHERFPAPAARSPARSVRYDPPGSRRPHKRRDT